MRAIVEKVLATFRAPLSLRGPCHLNVMLPYENEMLRIFCVYPEHVVYMGDLSFAPSEGGAGKAFTLGKGVYLPSVLHRHGISVAFADGAALSENEYGLLRDVYVQKTADAFECVLSLPIGTKSGTLGVLNVDSNVKNAFGEEDFHIADMAARFVAMVVQRYRAQTP